MSITINTDSLSVRRLSDSDRSALAQLAGRDTAPVPPGELIGAEADGRLVAALSLDDGAAIADPFVATASAVEMLELRAAHLRNEGTQPKPPLRGKLRRILDGLARGHAHSGLAGSAPTAAGRASRLRGARPKDAAKPKARRRLRIPKLPRARGALAGSVPGSSNLLQL